MRIKCLRDIRLECDWEENTDVGRLVFVEGKVYDVSCNCANDAEECECSYEGRDERGKHHFLSIEYIRENFEILS